MLLSASFSMWQILQAEAPAEAPSSGLGLGGYASWPCFAVPFAALAVE